MDSRRLLWKKKISHKFTLAKGGQVRVHRGVDLELGFFPGSGLHWLVSYALPVACIRVILAEKHRVIGGVSSWPYLRI
jgi:hypothetical protein